MTEDFEIWLSKEMEFYGIDGETYGSYIIEMLKDDSDEDVDILIKETLTSVTEENIDAFTEEILMKWKKIANNNNEEQPSVEDSSNCLTDILSTQLNLAQKQSEKKKDVNLSEERKSVKESVMALYGTMMQSAASENYEEEDCEDDDDGSDDDLFTNTNAKDVANAEQRERNKRKEESQRKKEKDKLDLEAQKLKKIERKDKEKKRTQKRERGGK